MNRKIQCDCGSVKIELTGKPRVQAYCHCIDCRQLSKMAFSALTAWNDDCVEITNGKENLIEFSHPDNKMKRNFCSMCGDTLFYTNRLGWRIISQVLMEKFKVFHATEFSPEKHLFYEQRIININDSLPKYLRGSNSQVYSGS